MECIFCNIDNKKIENTILDETENFYVLPTVASLVDGYILVVSKRHINSMSELTDIELEDYKYIINKYREIFKKIYDKYPIIFEHGSPILNSNMKANSVTHAHTHIVNHKFAEEQKIIKILNLRKINDISEINNKENYIMYINSSNICYITYRFESVSQIMRKLIAIDLDIEDKFDWQKEKFVNNINSTITKINLYNKKESDLNRK